MKKSADGFTYNHVQILTKNEYFDSTDKSFNFYQIADDFDGIVLVVNQKNEAVQFSSFKNSLILKPSITGKMATTTCIYMGWEYENGDFRAIALVGCFGGGGDSNDNGGYPPHVGGGGSGVGSVPAESTAQIIEENIDDSKLTPCYKEVMDQLKNGTVCEIQKVFDKLNADISKYKITFVNGVTDKDVANTQRTDPKVPFDYTITIDPDRYTSGTKLFKANVLLHELTHAYFSNLVDDYNSGSSPSALNDFPTLFQAFVDKKYPNSDKSTLAHHEEMANTYVDAISSALQEYQTGMSVPYGTAQQEYRDLAWHGLEKTAIYGKLSQTDRTRIVTQKGMQHSHYQS